MSKFERQVAVSNENGLKMDVPNPMTSKMLSNPEKKSFLSFEKAGGAKPDYKGKKSKTDNEQEIV